MHYLILLFTLIGMTACSNERVTMPTQQWDNINIEVETRPPRAVLGMNEFVIIASRKRRPVADIIVSIQIMGTGKWQQAIQDGHIGVFRKSLPLRDLQSDSLLVHIRHSNKENKKETILEFPLRDQRISTN